MGSVRAFPLLTHTRHERARWAIADPSSRDLARPRPASIRLDAREPNHLGPLVGLIGDVLAEVGGRAWKGRDSQAGKPCLDAGVGEPGVDRLVEDTDKLGRCAFRN